jgi:hypothetical protein
LSSNDIGPPAYAILSQDFFFILAPAYPDRACFDENGGNYRARMIRKLGIEDLPAFVRFPMKHGFASLD